MLILTLRTDKPEAEIGLFDDAEQVAYATWAAHRKLAETIHLQIKELLNKEGKSFDDLKGVVIYKGPGSFTGLRIGFSVANALSDSIQIPIVAADDHKWAQDGIARILSGDNENIAHPNYGSAPHTTLPRK